MMGFKVEETVWVYGNRSSFEFILNMSEAYAAVVHG